MQEKSRKRGREPSREELYRIGAQAATELHRQFCKVSPDYRTLLSVRSKAVRQWVRTGFLPFREDRILLTVVYRGHSNPPTVVGYANDFLLEFLHSPQNRGVVIATRFFFEEKRNGPPS